MFTNPSFIFDILCAVFLIIVTLMYARKGLLATLVQGLGTLISLIGARAISAWAAPLIFENVLAQGFTSSINNTIVQDGTVNLAEIAEKYAGFLPSEWIDPLVASMQENINGMLGSSAATIADTIVREVIEPLITPIIAIMLFFIAFVALRMVVSLLVTLLKNVNSIPVIGGANRMLGFVFGLLAAVVDLLIVLCILSALITITGGTLPYLNNVALENSLFYGLFQKINPFQ